MNQSTFEARVAELEAQGMTTSDAQSVAEAELVIAGLRA